MREGRKLLLESVQSQRASLEWRCHEGCHRCFFVMSGSQVKSFDDEASGCIRFEGSSEALPSVSPLVIGQQLLLPLAVQEGSRFATEAINHMAVVDAARSPKLLIAWYRHSGQCQHLSRAHEADNVVMVEMQGEALSDQARRHRVEDAAHAEGAMTTDPSTEDFVVWVAVARQRLELRLFFGELLSLLGIELGDDRLNENLIGRSGGKVKAAATIERLA
jgi:hypothetical protein